MSEMIERVAKAIEEADANGYTKLPYWKCARVAIEAMREPTDAMHSAAYVRTEKKLEDYEDEYLEVWQAMIDEALK